MRALALSGSPIKSVTAVDELLEESLRAFRLSADTSDVTFTSDVPATLGSVCVDGVLVRQVVFNLLRNAVEAIHGSGRRDGSVRIRARRRTAHVEIAIEDNGPGLPELPPGQKLFESRVTSKSGGMGMGLMLSRSIIEAHGGDLWADPACGDGATFRFTLRVEPL
jgi:two-component system sensor kinase FixL